MNRAEKQALIENVNAKLNKADIALVVHNNGLTVAQMTQLRRNMRDVGAEFKVAKNRLVKLAVKNTKFEGMEKLLKGPSAIATSSDPVSVAKSLVDFAKTNDKLVIRGGAFGGKALDVNGVKQLANIP
ncbi:MAG: 50S ribosomal protein L10, partial [Rickettsiales bacterium]|nr:50S ribosomal protein L10 [Rickettsiales bacterium]